MLHRSQNGNNHQSLPKALDKAGIVLSDVSIFLNEAFAGRT
jgi:hypothetical protein